MDAITLIDGYKADHRRQYPDGFEHILSNSTARSSRIPGQDHVIFFGLQYFLARYLIEEFNRTFFHQDVDVACRKYERRMLGYLGPNGIGSDHIRALHNLGFLPVEFRALPEGAMVPLGVPMYVMEDTMAGFGWIVNYIETLTQSVMWLPTTSATTASRFRKILEAGAELTGSDVDFIDWQGHDFSFRGMHNPESATLSGLGHLLFFTGSDTVPCWDMAEEYYGGFAEDFLVCGSVAATEHSVVCAGGAGNEYNTVGRLLDLYPTGILSYVSDTWDLWTVLTDVVPALKDKIMERDGKLVIRPDSGDPIKIVCGDPDSAPGTPEHKGVIELLWDTFGGTESVTGHKILDSHIGCIYGDGISEDRMHGIIDILARKGFASQNMVFGLGSYTYTFVTRDTYGIAMKATWCMIDGVAYDMFKDPITDDGGKRSAKGRLAVHLGDDGKYILIQQATPAQEATSLLRPVWRNGEFTHTESFDLIRARARQSLLVAA